MIRSQRLLSRTASSGFEVYDMIPVGLLFIGLLIRTVFAAAIFTVGVWFLLKIGRLIDAYTERIKANRTTK